MELVAELRGRGQTRSVRVPVPPPCPAEQSDTQDWELSGQLRGLRRGLAELQERVVQLLEPLVQEQREAAGGGRTRGCAEDEEDDEEEDEEDEDEDIMGTNANTEHPPPKRTKVQQP